MTIRLKSHLILGTVFLSGLLLLGTAGRSVLGRALLDIEAEGSRRDGERVLGELADLEARIGSTASDWGSWDDTYQFVTGRDSTYPARNVDVPTLLNLQLNLLALFDNEGRLAYATFLPRDGKALQSVAPALGRRLQKVALHRLAAGGWPAGGLLPNGDLPLLVSAHPVLRSNRKGPAAGMIVVGRFLDRPELDRLGAKMGLSLSLRPVGPALAPDFRRAVEALSGEVRYYSHPLDAREMGIYAPVSDLAGRPAAVLRATAPRGLHVFMAALVRRGALWAVGLGGPL
ncbi:MAG: hypothetical protein HY900_01205 [Deltaproteobacteria bacterium]|nr:hypothetical protein [Deltaproteobacteria bacterium]